MAEALIACQTENLVFAADIDPLRLRSLEKRYQIKVAESNLSAFEQGEIVVIAVKPQQVAEVLENVADHGSRDLDELGRVVTGRKLIISIAAGVPLSYLQKKLPAFPIIRAMPNNPCLVGAGITALAKGKKVNRRQYQLAEKIFRGVGKVMAVPEKWMDAVTGLSGSGPAFVYQVIAALTEGGVAAGLPQKTARALALQTVAGAAATLEKSGKTPAELCAMVASPGGTTIEGLMVLQKRKLKETLAEAVVAAAQKSRSISSQFKI